MADLETIHPRQHPIQDHQVRRVVSRQDQPHAAIGRCIYGVAFISQAALKQFQDLLIVFDNQNTLIHMICSSQNIPQLACRVQSVVGKTLIG